ncbi:MAG: hypothetical protein JNM07_09385 [Phycisphaerae bacterium]|nr:hypothetical protein [Phycisphaerae bacterium]
MSELPPITPPAGGPPSSPRGTESRRAASVTLREAEGGGVSSLMDPATQSLADAIRITYRLLQGAMVVLAALFLLSGFQSIKEGERGIRLVLGRVQADDLSPGFRFSLPHPFGELVKVQTGTSSVRLHKEFWPAVDDEMAEKSVEDLLKTTAGSATLDPGRDGSVITGDGNIAHTRWTVAYRRERVRSYAANVLPEDEPRIVRAAVMRGVVHACAGVTIDELLQSQAGVGRTQGTFRAVEASARQVAQATLDAMDSGITIEQLVLEEKIPPLRVFNKFAAVESAVSTANKNREEAQLARRSVLTAVAGEAAEPLLGFIDRYEQGLNQGDEKAAAAALASIEAVFEGRPAVAPDRESAPTLTGRAANLFSEARAYRSGAAVNAQTQLAVFRAKRESYRKNPSLLVNREITDALRVFLSRDSVQQWVLPAGTTTLELLLNRDPDIAREQERLRKQREAEEAKIQRDRDRDRKKVEEGETGAVKNVKT